MTVFKVKAWLLDRLQKVKTSIKSFKTHPSNGTGVMSKTTARLKQKQYPERCLHWIKAQSTTMSQVVAVPTARSKQVAKDAVRAIARDVTGAVTATGRFLTQYRIHILGTIIGTAALGGMVYTGYEGNQRYIEAYTYDIYHVYVDDEYAGTVNNPEIVDEFKIAKYREIQNRNPGVHMILNTDEVVLRNEKAYKGWTDNEAALDKLNELLEYHAVGVELVVNGEVVGIVKDQDTADYILNEIKARYASEAVAIMQQEKGRVSILSAAVVESELRPGESEIQEVGFVEEVVTNTRDIDPDEIMDPDQLIEKLETGDVQPLEYTVVNGDSVSVIAYNFDISTQVIYDNNPWIVNDRIRVGDVLNLTVLQPALSVRTVEKVVESQTIPYQTEYIDDGNLRAGTLQTIQTGSNGFKNVTSLVTKVNGNWTAQELLEEEILQEPVTATVRRGTKVILGEGTGRFAWPVVNYRITSNYGMRWGRLHKGIDLTGNRAILASDNGKVEYVGYKSDYGNHIIITHLNGFKTLYAHLSSTSVRNGQIVEKGEQIGVMGSTGQSTGVHLHFEILRNGATENPLKYLNR